MNALIEVNVDTNYTDDQVLMRELNKHLAFSYDKKTNQIMFGVEYGKDDHYMTLSVDKDELLDAIKRAEAKPLEE